MPWTLGVGVSAIVTAQALPPSRDPALLVWIGCACLFHAVLVAAHGPSIALHELGHALLGRLSGMTVRKITVGRGPLLHKWRWRDVAFELRTYLLAGGATIAYDRNAVLAKWRKALMLAGGVAANLALALALSAVYLGLRGTPRAADTFAVLAAPVVLVQVVMILHNLRSFDLALGHRTIASDGRQLLALLRAKDFRRAASIERLALDGSHLLEQRRFDAARLLYQEALETFPSPRFLLLLLVATAKSLGARATVQCYLYHRGALARLESDNDNMMAAFALATVAWQVARANDAEHLSLADDLSKEALAAFPQGAVVRGSRGGVLCRKGDVDAGVALLTEGLRDVITLEDKVEFAAFLADTVRATAMTDLADELDRLARYFAADPDQDEVSRLLGRRPPSGMAQRPGGDADTDSPA